MTLQDYETLVKRTLIITFIQGSINQLPPDELIRDLHRMFRLKKKVIANLTAYVQREVEQKQHDLQTVLANISLFAFVLRDFADRNLGQPLRLPS